VAKFDPFLLSVAEFRVVFILAKSDLALNAYEINKELLRINLDFFDTLTEISEYKAKIMEWSKFSSMFGSIREIFGFVVKIVEDNKISKGDNQRMKKLIDKGDVKSLRECEKIMRQYIDMPTVERITRILANLESEGYVIKREISKREYVWALPQDVKRMVLDHSDKLKNKNEEEFGKFLLPLIEVFQTELSQKPPS